MTYANPVIVRGEAKFLSDAAVAGADGILIVDMPPEEGGLLLSQKKIDPIYIIAPNTPPERRAMIGGGRPGDSSISSRHPVSPEHGSIFRIIWRIGSWR
jgi:Tryptophan synthase alpha chain